MAGAFFHYINILCCLSLVLHHLAKILAYDVKLKIYHSTLLYLAEVRMVVSIWYYGNLEAIVL